jgi:hypothetical protein
VSVRQALMHLELRGTPLALGTADTLEGAKARPRSEGGPAGSVTMPSKLESASL